MSFYLDGGGCGGFQYKLVPIDHKPNPMDIEVNNNDIKIYVDHQSEMFLIGTTIDYEDRDFSKGILHRGFKFIPEKSAGTTCGCGISFAPNFKN